MVSDWFKMTRNRSDGWRNRLYQSPVDPKLLKDKKRLQAMVQALTSDRLAGKPHFFEDLEQAFSLLHRVRLFLHLYLALEPSLREDLEHDALSILNELNTERVQLQAFSVWSVSSSTDSPPKWKAAQRRRGVSPMPWRAAVSFSEQTHFATDQHWVAQYRYDNRLHNLSIQYGGLSHMGAGLRDADSSVRKRAATQMETWLKELGEKGEGLFRSQTRLARKKRFNFAAIDASEKSLELARRVALERGPRLSARYFNLKGKGSEEASRPNWHDRYAEEGPCNAKPWKSIRDNFLDSLSVFHPEVAKIANRLMTSGNLIQPDGRGGGFTTPVFFDRKGRVDAGPFIYAPFDGSKDSARTLAHEMGHAIHAFLSAPLGPMQSDAGWAVAEAVALIFEHLYLSQDQKALADQDFAMLVHQPAIGMFERELGVSDDAIPGDAIWISALRAHYGPEVSLEHYGSFWRRHSSTLSAPGYPMAYLLGWALAGYVNDRLFGASDKVKRPMLDVLKAGGTIGYDDAAAMLGVKDIKEIMHLAYDRAENRLEQLEKGNNIPSRVLKPRNDKIR